MSGPGRAAPPPSGRTATAGAPSRLLSESLVDPADLVDEPQPERMLEVEDRVHRPVEVVGDVRDLFEQSVGRVRHDSPRRCSPATSTVNPWLQLGHVTDAWVWPSWLIRRERSWRNARSEAKRPSMTPVCTWGTLPSRVTTRDRSRIVR